ncbi:MAG: hypothetical protein CL904_06030 [Dehalococcoidia bacterium]|nr:hypothetical protein [Dehalococcoidia bacterium]MQG15614.1 DUF3500 domain-containing protein [SAR202 cluster bacterium]|tara:strand:- start:13773 stop:14810 length:1038 start_codon:yes stop_codon:yes gene_type:complete
MTNTLDREYIHSSPYLPDVAAEMTEAANTLITNLTIDQKLLALYTEVHYERLLWHYAPIKFRGLPLKNLDDKQKNLMFALLSTGLSVVGTEIAKNITALEVVLKEIEADRNAVIFERDPDLYYLRIFGIPGSNSWSWSVNGHHLFCAFTIVDGGLIASTPNFMGSNPGIIPDGYDGAGTGVLWNTDEMARELMSSFDNAQRSKALVSELAPLDIYTLNSPLLLDGSGTTLPHDGIEVTNMNKSQKGLFLKLLNEYIQRLRPELSKPILDSFKDEGFERLKFAWAGGFSLNEGRYFRIQRTRPHSLLIEQDNVQNDANHIHSVIRDIDEDFGVDLLRMHYEQSHIH